MSGGAAAECGCVHEVCVSVCVCVRVFACVRERERGREGKRDGRERERERNKQTDRQIVSLSCVCVRETAGRETQSGSGWCGKQLTLLVYEALSY